MKLFDSLSSLERVLDYHLARHSVLAANLANAETPGYKPRELVFSEAMAQAGKVAMTHPQHRSATASHTPFETREEPNPPASGEDNGVRTDLAMARLAANRLRYEAAIEIARRRLAILRYAATDGSGG